MLGEERVVDFSLLPIYECTSRYMLQNCTHRGLFISENAHRTIDENTRHRFARAIVILHVRSRVARATRHKEHTSGTEAPSSSSNARKLSAIGFPIVLEETFSAITVYARLEQAAASSASTTPVKVPRRLSLPKLQNQSAAVAAYLLPMAGSRHQKPNAARSRQF